MPRQLADERLKALQGVKCGACERYTARGTGLLFESPELSMWTVEYACDVCHELSRSWRPETEPLVRRIVRDALAPASAAIVSGEIGDDGPVARPAEAREPAAPGPALLRVRESASALASSFRKKFALTVGADGSLAHEELAPSLRVRTSPQARVLAAPHVLAPLRALVERAELGRVPATIGRGEHALELEWDGGGAPTVRAVRLTVRGEARDFGGDPGVGRELVELVDGLLALVRWIDAGGPDPAWPAPDAAPMFPRPDDLVRRGRAARLSTTHDWDGARPHDQVHELWLSDAGALERRVVRAGRPRPTVVEAHRESRPDASALLARLAKLGPASFRPQLGFVRTTCGLDTTYRQTLEFFDGERVHATTFVFGSERGIGVVHGDTPPGTNEAAAFELLGGLLR